VGKNTFAYKEKDEEMVCGSSVENLYDDVCSLIMLNIWRFPARLRWWVAVWE
jgi:hypothetical protein